MSLQWMPMASIVERISSSSCCRFLFTFSYDAVRCVHNCTPQDRKRKTNYLFTHQRRTTMVVVIKSFYFSLAKAPAQKRFKLLELSCKLFEWNHSLLRSTYRCDQLTIALVVHKCDWNDCPTWKLEHTHTHTDTRSRVRTLWQSTSCGVDVMRVLLITIVVQHFVQT